MAAKDSSPLTPRTFGELLVEAIFDSYLPVSAAIGMLVGVVALFIVPDTTTIRANIVVISAIVVIYIIAVLFRAAWNGFNQTRSLIPSVRLVREPPRNSESAKALLLLDRSTLFSHGVLVSIYIIEDEFERLIGHGTVHNIQDNGFIQVLVTRDVGAETEWDKISANDKLLLPRLRVKPHIISSIDSSHDTRQ